MKKGSIIKCLSVVVFSSMLFGTVACGKTNNSSTTNSSSSPVPTSESVSVSEQNTTCVVKFQVNAPEGIKTNTPSDKKVENGGKISKVSIYVTNESENTEHWAFVAWCTDAELKNQFDFDTPVTSDMTLYGLWQKKVVVNYVIDGEVVDTKYVFPGETASPDDGLAGTYEFGGYYTSDDYSTEFDFTQGLTQDTTIYLKVDKTSSSLSMSILAGGSTPVDSANSECLGSVTMSEDNEYAIVNFASLKDPYFWWQQINIDVKDKPVLNITYKAFLDTNYFAPVLRMYYVNGIEESRTEEGGITYTYTNNGTFSNYVDIPVTVSTSKDGEWNTLSYDLRNLSNEKMSKEWTSSDILSILRFDSPFASAPSDVSGATAENHMFYFKSVSFKAATGKLDLPAPTIKVNEEGLATIKSPCASVIKYKINDGEEQILGAEGTVQLQNNDKIVAMAVGDEKNYNDSAWSEEVVYKYVTPSGFPELTSEQQAIVSGTTNFLNMSTNSTANFGGLYAATPGLWGATGGTAVAWNEDAGAFKYSFESAADYFYIYMNQAISDSAVVTSPKKIKVLYYQPESTEFTAMNIYYGTTADWTSHVSTVPTSSNEWKVMEIDATAASSIELMRFGAANGGGDIYIKAILIEQ